MRNEIKASIIGAALTFAPLSSLKANNFVEENNSKGLGNNVKSELFYNLKNDDSNTISLQGSKEHESFYPIESNIVIDAALSYFDEEVKLYSLKGEARENVKLILKNYLSSHPILKKNSQGEVAFIIDDKPEFASMIKNLANTLFDGMPKVIRDIAIWIAFGGNEELQKTLNNLSSTLYKLPYKQFTDIAFDYCGGIVKRVCDKVGGTMSVGAFYDRVNEYYPNKNHVQILKELEGQVNNDIKNLKYPFKNSKKSSKN